MGQPKTAGSALEKQPPGIRFTAHCKETGNPLPEAHPALHGLIRTAPHHLTESLQLARIC